VPSVRVWLAVTVYRRSMRKIQMWLMKTTVQQLNASPLKAKVECLVKLESLAKFKPKSTETLSSNVSTRAGSKA